MALSVLVTSWIAIGAILVSDPPTILPLDTSGCVVDDVSRALTNETTSFFTDVTVTVSDIIDSSPVFTNRFF